MHEIRIHGRGGQGSVTLAHLMAEAAFEEGAWAQAFPSFGVERRGAPVTAFARLDDEQITDRSQVETPDTVIVQDASLCSFVDVTDGLTPDGVVIVNTNTDGSDLDIDPNATLVTVDATAIAMAHLGRPIMNTALLGAFAKATGALSLESVEQVITAEFGGEVGEKNVAASAKAYQEVTSA